MTDSRSTWWRPRPPYRTVGIAGQQVAHRVSHAADVRLLDWEAVGGQAAGQLGLAQGGAAFSLIELAGFLDAQGALDEREAAA